MPGKYSRSVPKFGTHPIQVDVSDILGGPGDGGVVPPDSPRAFQEYWTHPIQVYIWRKTCKIEVELRASTSDLLKNRQDIFQPNSSLINLQELI